MKISVIVPAYNEEKLLGETLEQLRRSATAFERATWEWELIVCDNNSTDRTAEIARAAGARVVFEPINQIARARNSGAAAASGDWFIFVDADSRPSVTLFDEVVEEIRSGSCLAGGCTIKLDGEHRGLAAWVSNSWNWLSRRFGLLAGSFIFCETAGFRTVGGFNNELFASEELDLTKRLRRLARASRKRIVVLYRNPIVTSGRKLHLYTHGELLWFMMRTIFTAGGTLKRRESCSAWYDGRR